MKVLKRGDGWKLQVTCTGNGNGGGGCNSILEVSAEDIYQTVSTDITGYTDHYYTICCPVCNAETDIDSSKIPSYIAGLSKGNKKEYVLQKYLRNDIV